MSDDTSRADAPGAPRDDRLSTLAARRSVSPRRLADPGPGADELDRMLEVALRAPDHGGLVPWRVIEFPGASRDRLADEFVAEKRRRRPDADVDDLARTRAHALDAPVLLAFVVRIDAQAAVPTHEQWLGAGAALGNLLNAAHALGYGAIMLSGERCADRTLVAALGLREAETLAGFVSIGTVTNPPRPATMPSTGRVRSVWHDVTGSPSVQS